MMSAPVFKNNAHWSVQIDSVTFLLTSILLHKIDFYEFAYKNYLINLFLTILKQNKIVTFIFIIF